jgi:polar amino acid transport system permease protein
MKRLNHYLPLLFALILGIASIGIGDVATFLPQLLLGAGLTIEITVNSFVFAMTASFVAGLARLSRFAIIRWGAMAYIEVFRGTSLLVQLFWIFFVLPEFGINLSPFLAAVVGLSLNFGAYGAEIVRGAILSIPRGQYDAVVALNINKWRSMRRIILPQALIAMIPPFGNQCIDLMKSTALVSAITLRDLTFAAYQMNQVLVRTLQIFGVTMLIYYMFSQFVRIVTIRLEQRFAQGLSRGRG